MGCVVKLTHIDSLVFIQEGSCFVIIDVTVVRSTEQGDYWWELFFAIPLVKLVALHLDFMGPDDAQKVVVFQKLIDGFMTVEDTTLALGIFLKHDVDLVLLLIYGVRPE